MVVDGGIDAMEKHRCVGFDVVDEAAQQGVMSMGCTFKPVNTERRCIEWEGSIVGVFKEFRCGGSGLKK